jgi:predicted alpha/beta superfamily hydrolase
MFGNRCGRRSHRHDLSDPENSVMFDAMNAMRYLAARTLIPMVVVAPLTESLAQTQPVVVPRSQQLEMVSSGSHRHFTVFIAEPAQPPSSKSGYPTIYLLDANSAFLIAAGSLDIQATTENDLEPTLLIGIGYNSNDASLEERRFYDLTPTPSNEASESLSKRSLTKLGGADELIDFIEHDLKPYVALHFRTDQARQALVGHSLGGLFVLYTLLTQPNTFSTFISGSPSIWVNRQKMFGYIPKGAYSDAIQYHSEAIGTQSVLITVGSAEPRAMIDDARLLAHEIAVAYPSLNLCFLISQSEDHVSMVSRIISMSIKFFIARTQCDNL